MGPPPGPVRRGVGSDTAWTGLPSCHDSFGMRSGWQRNCCQACVVWQQQPAVPAALALAYAGTFSPRLVCLRFFLSGLSLSPLRPACGGADTEGSRCCLGSRGSLLWGWTCARRSSRLGPGAGAHGGPRGLGPLGQVASCPVCSVEWQEPPRVGSPAATPQQVEATWPGPRQDGEAGVSPHHGPSRQEAVEL